MGDSPRADWVEILMCVSASDWHGERMTTTGGSGPRPGGATWMGEAIVTTCVIVALLPLGYLHMRSIGAVDPLTDMISDYVFQPGGYALLGVAAISLATACAVLATGLSRAGLPRSRWPATMLISSAVALVAVAVFPTHHPGTGPGVVSTVHRAAGGWVFAFAPLACWLVARRARVTPSWAAASRVLGWSAGITGVLSALFLLSHVPIVIAGSSVLPLLGGVQRVLFAGVMLVLVATARATRIAVEHAQSAATLPPEIQLGGAA